AILSVDIAGPFPVSVRGNSYFAEIVDHWSRKVWIILLAYKSELPKKLNELSIVLEKQSGEEILAGRSDGAPEILKIFGEWKSKKGVVPQTTAPYSSNQNGVAERGIQTSENEARALLQDSEMPVEFWDYAVESGAYIRNRLQRGPWIKREHEGKVVHQQLSPEGAWTGVHELDIENLRVWGCQAISYADIRSMPSHARKDKLMPRGRDTILVGYVPETTKQWKMWAPDLRRVIVVKRATFFEDKKGGKLDLNLKMVLSSGRVITGNGTLNTLPERNPRGRPSTNMSEKRHINEKSSKVEHLLSNTTLSDPDSPFFTISNSSKSSSVPPNSSSFPSSNPIVPISSQSSSNPKSPNTSTILSEPSPLSPSPLIVSPKQIPLSQNASTTINSQSIHLSTIPSTSISS
ncbi:hypothetical protein K3495_g15778, partial [Podosphaera aphanis]